jgi:hypothetical protein
MQSRLAATAIACFALSAGTADAGQTLAAGRFVNPTLSRQAAAPVAPAPAPLPKGFAQLFQPRPAPSTQSPRTPDSAPAPSPAPQSVPLEPRIACGMTLVPVDPALDPKIRTPAPTRPKPSTRSSQVTCP